MRVAPLVAQCDDVSLDDEVLCTHPVSVLLVTRWYGGDNNGVGILTETLAQSLRAEGNECVVVELLPDGIAPRRRIGRMGETIWGICLRPQPQSSARHRLIGYALRNFLARRLIRRLTLEHALDIAHIHYASTQYDCIASALRSVSLPWVVTFHGSDLLVDVTDPTCHAVMHDLVTHAEAVSTVSDALRDVAVRTFPEVASKTSVVYNSVGMELMRDAEGIAADDLEVPAVLFLGNLVKRKAADVLLRAWAALVQSDRAPSPWTLVVAGDGEQMPALTSFAIEQGIADRIQFFGAARRTDVAALLSGASIMVVPSRTEPFGLVAAEGQMFGRPVVASATGGLSEVIQDGVTGLLVPPDDAPALAAALAQLIANPNWRRELGTAAHVRALQQFSPRTMARAYLSLYSASLGRGPHEKYSSS